MSNMLIRNQQGIRQDQTLPDNFVEKFNHLISEVQRLKRLNINVEQLHDHTIQFLNEKFREAVSFHINYIVETNKVEIQKSTKLIEAQMTQKMEQIPKKALDEHKDRVQQKLRDINQKLQKFESEKLENLTLQLKKMKQNLSSSYNIKFNKLENQILQLDKSIENTKNMHFQGIERVERRITEKTNKISQMKNQMEVMNNKINELIENKEGKYRNQLLRIFEEQPQNLFDATTAYAGNFIGRGNMLTLQTASEVGDGIVPQQALLNIVVGWSFSFRVHIKQSKRNDIVIGVMDRNKQRNQRTSKKSGHAVCLSGKNGNVYYGNHGDCFNKEGKEQLRFEVGMQVRVVVDKFKSQVCFTLTRLDKKVSCCCVTSDILPQPGRQFVPYFQMCHRKDQIQWFIE